METKEMNVSLREVMFKGKVADYLVTAGEIFGIESKDAARLLKEIAAELES